MKANKFMLFCLQLTADEQINTDQFLNKVRNHFNNEIVKTGFENGISTCSQTPIVNCDVSHIANFIYLFM